MKIEKLEKLPNYFKSISKIQGILDMKREVFTDEFGKISKKVKKEKTKILNDSQA